MIASLSASELEDHAYAIEASGYSRVPGFLGSAELLALQAATDRGLAAVRAAYARGEAPLHDNRDYFFQARCLYVWGEAMVRLLEHPVIHALADAVIGPVRLIDLVATLALPAPETVAAATSSWHRDFDSFHVGAQPPTNLWFFLALDDLTPANGATWVVPGSHRRCARAQPPVPEGYSSDRMDRFPSRVQLLGVAGDLLVVNPSLLHTSGRNTSSGPRRLLNVALGSAELRPIFDHWSLAGPALQGSLGPRARHLMDAGPTSALSFGPTLPPGWVTGTDNQRLLRR